MWAARFPPKQNGMRSLSSGNGRTTNLLLCVVSLIVVIGGIELGLTLLYPTEYLQVPDRTPNDPLSEILHRSSTVPDLAFELTPNKQRKYEGIWIRTNNFGMRDSAPIPRDKDGTFRVVVLGDSFTFGWRVAGNSSYPEVLEQRLNAEETGKRFDVLNLGVCSYNTRDEALVLEHKGLEWQPDLVILGYVLNDPETEPVQPLTSYFQEPAVWQRSNLARLIAKAKNNLEIKLWGDGDYYRYLHAEGREKWDSVLTALDDIQNLTEAERIPVLVVIFPESPDKRWSDYPYSDLHRQIAEASRDKSFAVVDLLDRFSEHPPRALRVRRGDPHPSLQGHEIAADAIYDWIAGEFQEVVPIGADLVPST